MFDPLCTPPPAPPGNACDAPPAPRAAPLPIVNPPGLPAIAYRIGTFDSFRRAMLNAVSRPDLMRGAPNPFTRWREGAAGDYHTLLIELWAYLADVLTFYQERIANEAYLPTATQRDSLLRIVDLVDYRPSPGAGAGALLAFTVERGKSVVIPAGFRAGNKPDPGKTPAVFETDSAMTAVGEYSSIPLSTVAPTDQFAPLAFYRALFRRPPSPVRRKPLPPSRPPPIQRIERVVEMRAAAIGVYGRAGLAYMRTLADDDDDVRVRPVRRSQTVIDRAVTRRLRELGRLREIRPRPAPPPPPEPGPDAPPAVLETTRTIVLKGSNNRLAAGDYLLLVETLRDSSGAVVKETPMLRQVAQVNTDKDAGTTTVDWIEEVDAEYDPQAERQVYAFRVTAAPFGNNAPNWFSLPPALNGSDNAPNTANAPYKTTRWDDITDAWSFIPMPPAPGQAGDPTNVVHLDSLYPEVRSTADRPGWAALIADFSAVQNPDPKGVTLTSDQAYAIYHAVDARPVSKAAYAISGKVTRLTLDDKEALPEKTFPLRGTVVLAGSEPLALQNNLALPEPLAGATLVLAGLYPQLRPGQTAMLRGRLYDPTTTPPSQEQAVETVTLAAAPALDDENNITVVTLKKPLANRYVRAGAVLLANVAAVTQGETVRSELLGSGDGSAFQSFTLKQSPLTYLPATDAEGSSALQSTLTVTVNGVRWAERPSLLASAPDAQDYTTVQDDAGRTTVVFGDGRTGARPPSGQANIRARYRKGLGSSGNLAADKIRQLVDSLPGVQQVTNPQPSTGGADPERPDQIRTRAPASLRTFGRAVSIEDYAALALSFPGVAKASAMWVRRDPATGMAIAHPYIHLIVATGDLVPLEQQPVFASKLRAFLDERRDPNVPLRVGDFTPVFVDVAATIDVLDRFPRQATLAAALAALNPGLNPDKSAGLFAFERMTFGQSVYLSAVYAALQAVPGIASATVTTLRRTDTDSNPATVREQIPIPPGAIAIIKNDPADDENLFGKLRITLGRGGFVDA